MTPKFVLVQKEESRNNYEIKEHFPSYLERIVKNKLDYLSSNAETSVASISEIMNRLTNQNEVEDDLHVTDPATSPAHITASPTANKANKAKHHRRSRSVDTNVDLEPALPSDGAHVDFGGSKRSMLSKSDRAREMKKIRDRELFGVYGQGRGVHIEGKHHDEGIGMK